MTSTNQTVAETPRASHEAAIAVKHISGLLDRVPQASITPHEAKQNINHVLQRMDGFSLHQKQAAAWLLNLVVIDSIWQHYTPTLHQLVPIPRGANQPTHSELLRDAVGLFVELIDFHKKLLQQ